MDSLKTNAAKNKHAGNLKLLGGSLCLDFVNTIEWWGKKGSKEYLKTYHDLIMWGRHTGILNYQDAKILSQRAYECRSEADMVLKRGLELRKNMYNLFSEIAAGNRPTAQTLRLFNKHLAPTMRSIRILEDQNGFQWDASGDKTQLGWILNPPYPSVFYYKTVAPWLDFRSLSYHTSAGSGCGCCLEIASRKTD